MSDNSIAPHLHEFLDQIDDHTPDDKLVLTAGLVELFRRARPESGTAALAALAVNIANAPWHKIPFSLTQRILSKEYRTRVNKLGVPEPLITEVLLTSLCVFLDNVAQGGDPTEDALKEAIDAMAEEVGAAAAPAPPAPPDIFSPRMVRRVFEPAEFNADTAKKLQADIVNFRALTALGAPGPEVRGLAFDNGTNRYFVILETGEYLTVPKDYEHLVLTNDPSDYKNLFPTTLLALNVIAEQLDVYAVIDKTQREFIENGGLGKMTKPHFFGVTDVADISPLEHVFDTGREAARIGVTGATGPTGATVRFPVPATDMVVVLDARQDSLGPYSTARLVRVDEAGNETVVMRHETPRLYSLRGVYLFPLPDRLISLTVIF